MTDIDLTPMNDATARELFAWDCCVDVLAHTVSPDMPDEHRVQARVHARQLARESWDAGKVPRTVMHDYREKALAATLTTWRDVARQAVEQCLAEVESCGNDECSTVRALVKNPYDPEADQ